MEAVQELCTVHLLCQGVPSHHLKRLAMVIINNTDSIEQFKSSFNLLS